MNDIQLFIHFFRLETHYNVIRGMQRITVPEILQNEWFRKGYKRPKFEGEGEDVNLDDVNAVFNDSQVRK